MQTENTGRVIEMEQPFLGWLTLRVVYEASNLKLGIYKHPRNTKAIAVGSRSGCACGAKKVRVRRYSL